MSINEFERNKPVKTKKAILDLKYYVRGCIQENEKNRTFDMRLQVISESLDKLEVHFLNGE